MLWKIPEYLKEYMQTRFNLMSPSTPSKLSETAKAAKNSMVYEIIPTKLSSIIPYIPYNTAVFVFPRFRAVVKHLSVVVRMAARCYAPASESF